jgi:argininosuccinate lyase
MERAALKGYATATDLADYLVKKGLPFRDAHEVVAHAVKAAVSHNCDLTELPLAVLKGFHASIEKDVYDTMSLRGSLNARNVLGGHRAGPGAGPDRPASSLARPDPAGGTPAGRALNRRRTPAGRGH